MSFYRGGTAYLARCGAVPQPYLPRCVVPPLRQKLMLLNTLEKDNWKAVPLTQGEMSKISCELGRAIVEEGAQSTTYKVFTNVFVASLLAASFDTLPRVRWYEGGLLGH